MNESSFILIGLGGCGGKIADAVVEASGSRIRGVVIDTDFTAITRLVHCQQIRIGATRFGGLGSGGDRSGASMAIDEESTIGTLFDGATIAIVIVGIGRGTGSGSLAKLLAKAAERNVATLVFMVAPFQFEGTDLTRKAAETEQAVRNLGDIRIICRNDDLCVGSSDLTLEEAFAQATRTLADGILLLWRLAAQPGYINLDFATLTGIVKSGRGTCHLGVSVASGPARVKVALEVLFGNSGMGLGNQLATARAALVGILGGEDLRLKEIADTMSNLGAALPMDVNLRMGTVLDPDLTDSVHLVALLFREWRSLDGAENDADEPSEDVRHTAKRYVADSSHTTHGGKGTRRRYNDRFQNSAATCVNGENLDKPTFMRRKLHIDLT